MQKSLKNKVAPTSIQNIEQWQLSRKKFVKGLLLAGVLTQLPFLSACTEQNINTEISNGNNISSLNKTQISILKDIQLILFPNDGNGPSAKDVNAHLYLEWVISDARMDPSEAGYIVNGLKWTNETAQEEFDDDFLNLSDSKKEKLVRLISGEKWGESWLSVILTLIFEALLCDPQYGGNTNNKGWNWLNHNPGYPRPSKELLYDNILETVNNRKP